jgi:hypothetical protein
MPPAGDLASLGDHEDHLSGLLPAGAVMIDLGGRPHYVHSGWFLISDANLVVIVAMLVVFALAIILPFPGGRNRR